MTQGISVAAYLGRLARSAAAHGAPWEDIGSSLGLSGDRARRAYERRD